MNTYKNMAIKLDTPDKRKILRKGIIIPARFLFVTFMTTILIVLSNRVTLEKDQDTSTPDTTEKKPIRGPIKKATKGRINKHTTISDDIRCLTINLFHEAAGEPLKGQELVVQVVINRRNLLGRFGRNYCEVIRQPYQFSWTLDISKAYMLKSKQPLSPQDFKKYSKVVIGVLQNQLKVLDKDKEILYYHSIAVKPKWAAKMKVVYRVGNHIFYRE